MKSILTAVTAVLLTLATPAFAQSSGGADTIPTHNDRPNLQMNGQRPPAGHDQRPGVGYDENLVDLGTTQSIAPFPPEGTYSAPPDSNDPANNGNLATGGRAG